MEPSGLTGYAPTAPPGRLMGPRSVALLLFAASSPALAAWPEDVDLRGMSTHGGQPIADPAALGDDYGALVRQLGAAVGMRSVLPAATLGARGFELTFDQTLNFTDVTYNTDAVSPWDRASSQEDASPVLFQPGISVRKGLPMSLELGFHGRWMGQTRQGVFGGFVRAGLVEGWKPAPDVNLHLGYTGYIGNDQLDLGVFDVGLTIGTGAPVGPGKGARHAKISPFADVSLLVVTATPRLTPAEQNGIGAVTYGRRAYNDTVDVPSSQRAITMPQFSGGLEIQGGSVVFRLSGGYTLKAIPSVAASLGFVY